MQSKPTEVSNPRTYGQMEVRSSFATCVNFYKHSQQIYWKYSYQDKKRNENDYNAFVRKNFKNALSYPKPWLADPKMPMLGLWQLSDGSLPTPVGTFSYELDNNVTPVWQTAALPSKSIAQADLTIGDFWKAFLEVNPGLSNGDALTFVGISTGLNDITGDDGVWEALFTLGAQPVQWFLTQVIINTDDTTVAIAKKTSDIENESYDFGHGFQILTDATGYPTLVTFIDTPVELASDSVLASFIVASGKRDGIIEVSTSFINGNAKYKRLYSKLRNNDAFWNYSMKTWQATDESVLEGGIVHAKKPMKNHPPLD